VRWRRLLLFVLLSVLTHAWLFFAPPLSDEAAHLVGSWTLLRGGHLYIDFVDNKPPLLYVFYAAAQWMLGRGLLAVRTVLGVGVLPLCAYAASAFYGHGRAGLAAGCLYLVTSAAFAPEDALAVNTELLMMLPAAAAFVLMRDLAPRRFLAAGLAGALLGLATLFKITAVLWLPVPLALVYARAQKTDPRTAIGWTCAAVVLGFALPLVGALGVFAAQGSSREAVYWTFLHNLAYVTAPIGPREAFIRAMRGSGAWFLCTLPVWWVALKRAPSAFEDGGRRLALLLVACAVPAVFLGFRFFGHYYIQVLFPLCLAAGPATAMLARRPLAGSARVAAAAVAFVFVFCTAGTAYLISRTDVLESTRPVFPHVIQRLAVDACFERGSLFVWGVAPLFYTMSGLPHATRFVLPQETISGYVPGRSSDAVSPRAFANTQNDWARLFEDLDRNRATYILDTSPANLHFWGRYPLSRFPALQTYMQEHYEAIGVVDDVAIYRRRGCGAAQSGGSG
jgi:4-amino-4-deoxy-L-arabinose transferase-like glycosyltransferase